MVSISRPIVPPILMPTPRYTTPISFASRHIYTTFMMSVALVYAIISIHMVSVSATYLTPGDCPIQHCLLEAYQPEIDYFPLKLTTQQNPNFAIQYYNNFKVLKNLWTKEDYVITLCGTPVPTNNSMVYRTIEGKLTQVPLVLAPTAKFVTGPITKVAIDETITANMMELLGARRTIAAMDVTYITSPCLHAMQEQLQILPTFPGSWGNVTRRQQLIDQVDIVIGGNTPNAKPKFIQASVTAELKPQGRLEWVKFIGALLNREYAAQHIYDETLQRYNQLKAQAAAAAKGTSPIVAWLDFQKGNTAWGTVDAWKISVADYKLQYTRDAAATPFVPNITSFSDPNQAIQTLIDGSVDIVIDETYINYYAASQQSYDDFLRVWNITNANAKFIQQKQVWRHDRMQTAAGGDDWFERAIIQIDAVLQDMISFIHPNKVVAKDTPRVWFRDFVAGEPLFQTVDRCLDISAPLFPLLAEPLSKTAPCPTLPIETLVDYKPKPTNGAAQMAAPIMSIVTIIMAAGLLL